MMITIASILLIIAAIAIVTAVWTRLSVHRVEERQAYLAGIKRAEKKQFDRVYGRYIHA